MIAAGVPTELSTISVLINGYYCAHCLGIVSVGY